MSVFVAKATSDHDIGPEGRLSNSVTGSFDGECRLNGEVRLRSVGRWIFFVNFSHRLSDLDTFENFRYSISTSDGESII